MTDYTDITLHQSFNKSGTITSETTNDIIAYEMTTKNAWLMTSYQSSVWNASTPLTATTSLWRLTPDNNTSIDARPVVGENAMAFYGVTRKTDSAIWTENALISG